MEIAKYNKILTLNKLLKTTKCEKKPLRQNKHPGYPGTILLIYYILKIQNQYKYLHQIITNRALKHTLNYV